MYEKLRVALRRRASTAEETPVGGRVEEGLAAGGPTGRRAARSMFLAGALSLAMLGGASQAQADTCDTWVCTDLINWNIDTTTNTYGSDFTTSSKPSVNQYYRWLDAPPVSTVISTNRCPDLAFIDSNSFPSGSGGTSYRQIGNIGADGRCFRVRGRTTSGRMDFFDGRLAR